MVNLIIDTDLGNDCDDAAAIALACRYEHEGMAKLCAVTVNTSDPYSPACVEAILSSRGVQAPVGAHRGNFPYSAVSYSKRVAEKFCLRPRESYEDAVRLLRRTLASCREKSVTLVFIGQLNNANCLLRSPADEYGADGRTLVGQKVKQIVVMGGMFGGGCATFEGKQYVAEYNIALSVADSRSAIGAFPVETVFADFCLGVDVCTLGGLIPRAQSDPVAYAYEIFAHGDRPSWDILAVIYAVEGEGTLFTRSPAGTVAVEEDGRTVHTCNEAGRCSYLIPLAGKEELKAFINRKFDL